MTFEEAHLLLLGGEPVPSHIANDPAFQAYRRAREDHPVYVTDDPIDALIEAEAPMPGRSNILPFRRPAHGR
ncbi:hypothetical protein GCM10008171_32410 [Methylopila jiangsuensis]|uniref:Uncharacterized protein n=1 Tax=Methylopila jiangsuensis TaxID=586230 RepID=A0A9W6JIS9_9HYPH|nr:hypothetical protein [Methylopila jiangsuensis]MDR6284624.1 hypothetical protein [Methylopila jiangsuensis]GLK77987.1 hypothetical protein GCM10008171_32410 [Methylopila jiangsuensis]